MKAKLQSVFDDDDRGVSPVIGVILMVAITVILAAVIGGFVLNLGGDLQQTPQAQISISTGDAAGDGTIKIAHKGGDELQTGDLTVNGASGLSTEITSGTFSVGDTATNGGSATGETTVTIIHEPSESILAETTVTNP